MSMARRIPERALHMAESVYQRLRPQLWRFKQYAPRLLKFPAAYARERPPENPPEVAIVTPSYNQGTYLAATIDSVLSQNYPRLQYRVEDGGSSDNSRGVLESYGSRLTWRSERDAGQADAINRGFSETSGEIMGYLNSDDLLLPGALAFVARAFAEHPNVDVVYGHRIYIDENGLETGRWVTVPHDAEALKLVTVVPQETMFWRRRVWERIGPFDAKLHFAFDWDFMLRAQAAGYKFRQLPRFLGCFRVHGAQKTATIWDVYEQEAGKLREKYLGYNPGNAEIERALRPFYRRQRWEHWMNKINRFSL
jgi:glycosyltransferase involved in cell wall biosynthesis